MKILVTGTDGYIGVVLADLLLTQGHEVVGLDTGFYRDGLLYRDHMQFPARVEKDIRHITLQDLDGFDAVVHLAELANDPLGQRDPAVTYAINYQASVALANKCKQVGIARFVYTSSCSVYGWRSENVMTEESEVDPRTVYAKCKVLVERDVLALADRSFAPTFLRNATVYGASPRMRFDLVLNNLAGQAWTTRSIKLTSDGTPWRPLVHVRDVCSVISCVLAAPCERVGGQIYNVGTTDENYRVREIASIVAQAFPGCTTSFGTTESDNRGYYVSFEKVRAHLPAFAQQWNVSTGVDELCDLFERLQLSPATFGLRAYTRLNQLEHLVNSGQLDSNLFWRSQ